MPLYLRVNYGIFLFMNLIQPVSLSIAIFAYAVALGIALIFFATALSKWSVDFFKDM